MTPSPVLCPLGRPVTSVKRRAHPTGRQELRSNCWVLRLGLGCRVLFGEGVFGALLETVEGRSNEDDGGDHRDAGDDRSPGRSRGRNNLTVGLSSRHASTRRKQLVARHTHPSVYGAGVKRNRLYRNGVLEAEDFPPAQISEYLAQPDVVVWLDLESPDGPELDLLAEEFGLNQLAVEDATHEHQRPKVDRYKSHIFMSLYGVHLDVETATLHSSELAVFASGRWLITVRKTGGFDMRHVEQVWDANQDLTKHGVGFLLYGLLDHVVDGHFGTVQELDEAIEQIEARLFDTTPQPLTVQRRSFRVRKALVDLRRVSLPMREVLNTLLRRDLGFVTEDLAPYYQDVYDHVLRVTEWTESLRDLVTTIQDSNLQVQSNRLNEVMKKLTAFAALFGAVAAITGFFGQNLPYPGFATHAGLAAMAILLAVAVVGLVVLFKLKDWL